MPQGLQYCIAAKLQVACLVIELQGDMSKGPVTQMVLSCCSILRV